jgi:signal transduction histidine kinase
VLELTSPWARWSKVATLAALLLLGAAVVATFNAAGAAAALALVAAASTVLLATVTMVARHRLRRGGERLRLGERALDAVPRAIFVVDALQPGRSNVYVNAAYSALTGYSAREAVATGFDALAIFADAGEVAALDGDTVASKSTRVGVRHRDGTTVPAKLEVRALPRDGGGRYIFGLLEGIAAGERAADRKPAASLAASDTDAAAARGRDAFLSWLNHELRSPLNACAMWVDVLALAPQPDKLTKAVEAIKRNIARQARLVNDLNDAARVSSGGLEIQLERVDLVALLKRGVDAWQLLAIAKQITLQSRIELEAAHVDGDPERLLQALNHLLENAISSTPSGGRIDLHAYGSGGNGIVELEDTGAALSPEDAAHLSEPLWRAPNGAKSRAGLGLGLAVAHHIAAKHGGSLAATIGASGTRFVLTLPLAADNGGSDPMKR